MPCCYDAGTTNIADGLRMARMQHFTQARGDRENVENIVILLSDGNDNVETNNLAFEVAICFQCL